MDLYLPYQGLGAPDTADTAVAVGVVAVVADIVAAVVVDDGNDSVVVGYRLLGLLVLVVGRQGDWMVFHAAVSVGCLLECRYLIDVQHAAAC